MSHATLLYELIKKYYPIAPASFELILEQGSFELYDRNAVVFYSGRYNGYEYFQLEGISHRYNAAETDESVTTGIQVAPNVITPHFARTRNGHSIFSLQTLSPAVFFQVPIGSFDTLRSLKEDIRIFGQRVVEKEFAEHLQYEVLFRSHDAKERLEYFRSTFPALENKIPHSVIASFLGITPVSFSRLRKTIAKTG